MGVCVCASHQSRDMLVHRTVGPKDKFVLVTAGSVRDCSVELDAETAACMCWQRRKRDAGNHSDIILGNCDGCELPRVVSLMGKNFLSPPPPSLLNFQVSEFPSDREKIRVAGLSDLGSRSCAQLGLLTPGHGP